MEHPKQDLQQHFDIEEHDSGFDNLLCENNSKHKDNASGEVSKDSSSINILTGIFISLSMMITASFCFCVMSAFCKAVYRNNPHLNGFDYMLFRSVSMTIFALVQAKYYQVNVLNIKKEAKIKLYIFGLCGGGGMPAFFVALQFIPMTIVSLIFHINPIIVAVIAPFILSEQLTKIKIFGVIGSFIGAFLFTLHKNILPGDQDHYYLGILLSFIGCMSGTLMAIYLRILNQQVHFCLCPVYFGFGSMFSILVVLIFFPSTFNFEYYTSYDCFMFIMSGIFNFIAQTAKSIAFKYEDASNIAPFGYFEVIFNIIGDIVIFSYIFVLTDIVGALLITTCLLGPVLIRLYNHNNPVQKQ